MEMGRNDRCGMTGRLEPSRLARPLAAVAVALALGTAQAQAPPAEKPCQAPAELMGISGKIFNNQIAPGETLGVGSAVLARSATLNCSLQGRAFFENGAFAGFRHTIVCGDRYKLADGDTVHSQIDALSFFEGMPAFQSCGIPGVDPEYGSFREISYPQSGRGRFSPTGGGRLFIEGTVNCAGAVEIKYSGEVCVRR